MLASAIIENCTLKVTKANISWMFCYEQLETLHVRYKPRKLIWINLLLEKINDQKNYHKSNNDNILVGASHDLGPFKTSVTDI